MAYTVGSYLAARLSQIGLKHHFAVAGDYNLVLLDELLTNKELKQLYQPFTSLTDLLALLNSDKQEHVLQGEPTWKARLRVRVAAQTPFVRSRYRPWPLDPEVWQLTTS